TTAHTYTVTSSTIDRSGAARITFAGIESLHLNKGPISGSAPMAQALALTHSVKVGQTATLAGRLTDADAGDTLSLTVDWGDGSKPAAIKPGKKLFGLNHSYTVAGTYTVRVIWTDSTGQSNFRDLNLVVTPRHLPAGPRAARRRS